jgi:hypothetical protein
MLRTTPGVLWDFELGSRIVIGRVALKLAADISQVQLAYTKLRNTVYVFSFKKPFEHFERLKRQ